MNIVNPDTPSHTLQIVPRFYPDGDVLIRLYDKANRSNTTATVTPVISGGYMYVTFNKDFKDRADFRITIESDDEIVYRGKIFATTQYNDTQNYKISKGIFHE